MYFFWAIIIFFMSFFFFLKGLFFLYMMNVVVFEYILLELGSVEIKFYLLFDWMSLLFMAVVLFISSMVIFYSNEYMLKDKLKVYFLYGMLLFVGSMVLLIVSPNMVMILLGWDGLGLVSYCLVIYYQNLKSDIAGMMTILSNRIGDVAILMAIVMLFNFGSLDMIVYKKMLGVAGMLLVIAGMTKSAQIPFSAWLPAAMAAPTPVSSLVHSSTLVTAGVYLLIRFSILFKMNVFSNFLFFFSLLTMIMAGIGAMFEMDLKKIIALSTLSQLGLMMLTLSVSMVKLSFFHLLTHAIFKALLFLCAGMIIHNSMDGQDIRFMGGFFKLNPLISGLFGLASFSLFGFPFLSGFYSKDMILEYIYSSEKSLLVLILVILATILTCVYSFRLMYFSIWKGLLSVSVINYSFSYMMSIPILVMGVVVIFFGNILMWLIFSQPFFLILNFKIKLLNLMILMIAFWLFFMFYFNQKGFVGDLLGMEFFSSLWFLSLVSSYFSLKMLKKGMVFMVMEKSWVEEIGPKGLLNVNINMSKFVEWLQFSSMFLFLMFMIFLMLIFIF
uniref:NADH-ubiquinone oxidoreductase chain 5 n=1 Tax=Navis striatus TaxID=1580118 RepID=A0A1P8AG91_9ACAR|nr:NADH dehydrogenase subunit 5 [Navis striatus]AIZ58462.1 NADH dehydrogenase subunit 5 [Navis striatus]AIZ58475.1 NADH dehydrogenase subunit 5 [Navis striatus]AMX74129.1 NADH dehydrogenase subunit 5 [Navis striatus]QLD97031.1 NADH dehydrogenase subunit 5 [Navis striatus]QLD97044.1 NADH dehydrogenase subunit 5 [Navis striatus]